MTFTSNIPAAGDSLGGSRAQIVDNFSNYKANWETNHGLVNDADSGKHLFMQMPEQVAAPTTAANEGALYTKVANNVTNLFFREENNGTERAVTLFNNVANDITRYNTNTVAYVANHNGGWTFLLGGLIIQYGVRSAMVSGPNTITFPRTFPTAVFSIQVTPVRDSSNIDTVYIRAAGDITTTNFIVRNTANGITSVHWLAIGN